MIKNIFNLIEEISKQDYINNSSNNVKELIKHLIKILKYDDIYNYNKHLNDINDKFLKKITEKLYKIDCKNTKKNLDKITYNALISDFNDNIDNYLKNIEINYNSNQKLLSDDEVKSKIKLILKEIADKTISRDNIDIIPIINSLKGKKNDT